MMRRRVAVGVAVGREGEAPGCCACLGSPRRTAAIRFGVLRIPVAVLQISGQMRPDGPLWYVILQGVIGLVQVLIALAMILGYRRSGVWGS